MPLKSRGPRDRRVGHRKRAAKTLRFERLEGRALMAAAGSSTLANKYWGLTHASAENASPLGLDAKVVYSTMADSGVLGQQVESSSLGTAAITASNATPRPEATGLLATPDQLTWDQSFTVAIRMRNPSSLDAPSSQIRLVLTPIGSIPGGTRDHDVAVLSLPAIEAGKDVDLSFRSRLPVSVPSNLRGFSVFTLSLVPNDHNFGSVHTILGENAVIVRVDPSPFDAQPSTQSQPKQESQAAANAANLFLVPARPNLTVTRVQTPTIPWTSEDVVRVDAAIANVSLVDADAFAVAFYLADAADSTTPKLPLGEVSIPALAGGATRVISANFPSPAASHSLVKVIAVVDSENRIKESYESDNQSESAIFTLRRPGLAVSPNSNSRKRPNLQLHQVGAGSLEGGGSRGKPTATFKQTPRSSPSRLRETGAKAKSHHDSTQLPQLRLFPPTSELPKM